MTKIEIVRPLWLNVLIDAGPEAWPSFRGLYLAKNYKGRWIACDNSTGECWVEEFTDGKEAAAWLLREDVMADKTTPIEVYEVCPHCEEERTFKDWDGNFHQTCPGCGARLMICSECTYLHDHERQPGCDYDSKKDTCFRQEKGKAMTNRNYPTRMHEVLGVEG